MIEYLQKQKLAYPMYDIGTGEGAKPPSTPKNL